MPEVLSFWQGKEHEIDFVLDDNEFLEIKLGAVSVVEFSWFPRSFPKSRLKVVNQNRFRSDRIEGLTLEDFLLEE